MAARGDSRYWPRIDSPERAKDLMHYGAAAAAFSALLTFALSASSLYVGHPVLNTDGWALLDSLLFAVVAWRVFKLSLPWAIVGLVLYTGDKAYAISQDPNSKASPVIGILFFLCYLHAVRAGLYRWRSTKGPRTGPWLRLPGLLKSPWFSSKRNLQLLALSGMSLWLVSVAAFEEFLAAEASLREAIFVSVPALVAGCIAFWWFGSRDDAYKASPGYSESPQSKEAASP